MTLRAVVFIDGNNWYHALKDLGGIVTGELDYARISRKLVQAREWTDTRYYIGQVRQVGNLQLYAAQRHFLARLTSTDARISVHLGRLEHRPARNKAASELVAILKSRQNQLPEDVYKELLASCEQHLSTTIVTEKAVDVMLALDMAVMAERDEYDVAYLLSADGDFTPAVAAVRAHEKQVFAVSPKYGARLGAACNGFIRIERAWLNDCYRATY